ncbi:hypothetical protein [Thermoflavimicrobium dichotomicum]|uniref:Uncharacterized protein n=1 Tax=Thermoflavimicrobium dichotomicum TaxID=46223 RepID=A0A1I3MNT7_9BACL|nr:hypothetical protein [Thermoflavimicrobium dichotomicum]SFI98326.1 hypothetical protein SAMN05421852_103132 [Thermoflavimicrobium dichotomicum]
MHSVILITGKVKFRINLDPTIWIVDDRHFPLSERLPGVEGLAMELGPFLNNAEPDLSATHMICHRSQGENVVLTMEEARSAYLCFAKNNQPIREGGPALLYLADGSNKDEPIDYLTELEVIVQS